ncbi:MAG TPA: ketose-bisphosphate aldolase, partial [Ruminococcaceae bacterium]|nr:ketose-bisphosphate aldolase [Oscillospiraceae bacterium]
MSLANMKDLLNQARQGNYAVGMFVMYDIEMATGLIQAAEETNSPLIMAYGELAEELVSIRHLSKAVHSMIGEAKVPIALHWDHGSGLDIAALALRSGFTSVMIDASAE